MKHPVNDDILATDEMFGEEPGSLPKVEVECICPKCRQRFVLKMCWIGRGTPRKYCAACKVATGMDI